MRRADVGYAPPPNGVTRHNPHAAHANRWAASLLPDWKTMNDLVFLKELRENVVKGKSDIARHEMALKMIDDWIDELEQNAAQHSVHTDEGEAEAQEARPNQLDTGEGWGLFGNRPRG